MEFLFLGKQVLLIQKACIINAYMKPFSNYGKTNEIKQFLVIIIQDINIFQS